jgi:hypothetical protein
VLVSRCILLWLNSLSNVLSVGCSCFNEVSCICRSVVKRNIFPKI